MECSNNATLLATRQFILWSICHEGSGYINFKFYVPVASDFMHITNICIVC